jgi:hypothetical protein
MLLLLLLLLFDRLLSETQVAVPEVVPVKGSKEGARKPPAGVPAAAAAPEAPAADSYAEQVGAIPALAQLGPIFKVCAPSSLLMSPTSFGEWTPVTTNGCRHRHWNG